MFDDYYPCVKNECNLFHVHNWIQFFVSMYNDPLYENYFINELNDRGEYILSEQSLFYIHFKGIITGIISFPAEPGSTEKLFIDINGNVNNIALLR